MFLFELLNQFEVARGQVLQKLRQSFMYLLWRIGNPCQSDGFVNFFFFTWKPFTLRSQVRIPGWFAMYCLKGMQKRRAFPSEFAESIGRRNSGGWDALVACQSRYPTKEFLFPGYDLRHYFLLFKNKKSICIYRIYTFLLLRAFMQAFSRSKTAMRLFPSVPIIVRATVSNGDAAKLNAAYQAS